MWLVIIIIVRPPEIIQRRIKCYLVVLLWKIASVFGMNCFIIVLFFASVTIMVVVVFLTLIICLTIICCGAVCLKRFVCATVATYCWSNYASFLCQNHLSIAYIYTWFVCLLFNYLFFYCFLRFWTKIFQLRRKKSETQDILEISNFANLHTVA